MAAVEVQAGTAGWGRWRNSALGLGTGLLFGVGLLWSGMTEPARILAFLDVAGNWDATLLFVMAGAVGVHATWLRFAGTGAGPAPSDPPKTAAWLDRRLIGGAALFGIGWGLSGYCPGPAIVALGFLRADAWLFVLGMVAGSWLTQRLVQRPS